MAKEVGLKLFPYVMTPIMAIFAPLLLVPSNLTRPFRVTFALRDVTSATEGASFCVPMHGSGRSCYCQVPYARLVSRLEMSCREI